jgi:lysozyme
MLDEPYIGEIKKREGFSARPKWDYKQWSWGHGTRAPGPTGTITPEQADADLRREVGTAAGAVDRFKPGLPAGPRAALTSLTFNAGPGWQKSGLGNAVAAGDWNTAVNRFTQYNKVRSPSGVLTEAPGLTARRAGEAKWFANLGGPPAASSPDQPPSPQPPSPSPMALTDAPPSFMPANPGAKYLSPAALKDLYGQANFWQQQATSTPNRRLTWLDPLANALAGYNANAYRQEAREYEAGQNQADQRDLATAYTPRRAVPSMASTPPGAPPSAPKPGPLLQPPGAAMAEPGEPTAVAGITTGRPPAPQASPPDSGSPAIMQSARANAGGPLISPPGPSISAPAPSSMAPSRAPSPAPSMATTAPGLDTPRPGFAQPPDALNTAETDRQRAALVSIAARGGPGAESARKQLEFLNNKELLYGVEHQKAQYTRQLAIEQAELDQKRKLQLIDAVRQRRAGGQPEAVAATGAGTSAPAPTAGAPGAAGPGAGPSAAVPPGQLPRSYTADDLAAFSIAGIPKEAVEQLARDPQQHLYDAYDKEHGARLAKDFGEIQDAGRKAGSQRQEIALLRTIASDPNTLQGWGTSASITLRRVAEAAGFKTEGLAPTQVFQALMNKHALEARSTSEGGGMPGAMSDADREFLAKIAGGTANSPEANLALLAIKDKMLQRQQQVGQLATRYARANNGRLDLGFQEKLSSWAEKNPLFTDEDAKSLFGGQPGAQPAPGATQQTADTPPEARQPLSAQQIKEMPLGATAVLNGVTHEKRADGWHPVAGQSADDKAARAERARMSPADRAAARRSEAAAAPGQQAAAAETAQRAFDADSKSMTPIEVARKYDGVRGQLRQDQLMALDDMIRSATTPR